MPYALRKDGNGWAVVNKKTGKVKGRSRSRKKAVEFMRALYANAEGKSAMIDSPEVLVVYGGEVKALGEGRYGGLALVYGDESRPDLSPQRDFMTPETDFWIDEEDQWGQVTVPLIYNHGLDPVLKKIRFGRATYKKIDAGIWAEWQLKLRKEYQEKYGHFLKEIEGLIDKKGLGLSTGVPGHLVEREKRGEAHFLKSWPLERSELSLTPTPAEPRTIAVSLKSLMDDASNAEASADEPESGESMVAALERTVSALEWARGRRDLNAVKVQALDAVAEAARQWRASRVDQAELARLAEEADSLLGELAQL